ncbi:hypothetical protein GLOTRDRAFT_35940 [Gloeophyllum trabeum ATCC 11539]|uniref:Uncharacterized protein n=1 Tax=Gloeophyllum trabeum (strain ATCC 11539 / FP-39264 / Madison 617) TaxID=670483 RepID=S7RXG7_GLOTA|nr:uncharacterized protein GLOTRDRAFT_35940 [Gloeophyllum trabeum ATCC 11539]EPQ58039.1 hypothetical protein GLOTRDRAFT_35940 [Gloeophyllum trabeum ATCC 11539]
MFATLRSFATLSLAATVAVQATSLTRRADAGQVLIGCYPGGAGGCPCPTDLNGDSGVLINVFPGYQCAYPSGACAWAIASGQLQDIAQGNCPSSAPCASGGCDCPADLNGDSGVLINQFEGYQCAYPNGACTWDQNGDLQNIYQGNCPGSAKC